MTTTATRSVGNPRPNLAATVLWISRALLLSWAGFWLWFIIASAKGDPAGLPWRLLFGGIAAGLLGVSWFWQRLGGVLMIATGLFSAWYFHNTSAYILLALPAVGIGVLLMLVPARKESAASRIE